MSSNRNAVIWRRPTRNEEKAGPMPLRPEAIAMRRIVVEMGGWLSPLLRDHPIPVLSEWERTVNLTKLAKLRSEENRQIVKELFESQRRAEEESKEEPKRVAKATSRDERERERLRNRKRTPEQLERKRQKDRERYAKERTLKGNPSEVA